MAKPKHNPCRVCLEREADSNEHVPPKSANNAGKQYAHSMERMMSAADANGLPIPLKGNNGIYLRTLCKQCNWDTQRNYNAAFADWTEQAQAAARDYRGGEFLTIKFREIRPLAIIKQIAVSALATGQPSVNPAQMSLRRSVRYAFEPGLHPDFVFRTYFYPVRESELTDEMMTTRRLASTCVVFDAFKGTGVFCFAEIGSNPLGYLIHYAADKFPLSEEAAILTDINGFARFKWGDKADITALSGP